MTRSSTVEPAAHNGLVVGSIPTGSTNGSLAQLAERRTLTAKVLGSSPKGAAKITSKSRVTKLLKMGLNNSQIKEVTNLSSNTIKQYIWQIRNPDKHKSRTQTQNKKNKDKIVAWNRNYIAKNKQLVKEKRAEYWQKYYYERKCRECGVEPVGA